VNGFQLAAEVPGILVPDSEETLPPGLAPASPP